MSYVQLARREEAFAALVALPPQSRWASALLPQCAHCGQVIRLVLSNLLRKSYLRGRASAVGVEVADLAIVLGSAMFWCIMVGVT